MPESDRLVDDPLTQVTIARLQGALRELDYLKRYYTASRGVGHTMSVVAGAQETGAVILAANQEHARSFDQFEVTARPRMLLPGTVGLQNPLLVDHSTLQLMITDAQRKLAEVTADIVREIRETGD